MASLGISRSEVYANLATVLGINRVSSSWDAQTLSDVQRVWRMGVRKFIASNDWKHLEETHTFVIPAVYETGTVTVVDGVVTLAGGTFPSWAANAVFLPDDGGVYEVSTRDGDTQLTLLDTSLDLAALSEFELRQTRFDLPSHFARVLEPFTIENSRYEELEEIPILPEWTLRGVGGREVPRLDRPEAFTTFQDVDEATNTFTPYLKVWPIPDAQYTVSGTIGVMIDDTLSQIESVVICNPLFSELLQESILAAGEQLYHSGEQNIHTQNFEKWLPAFVQKDRMLRGVRSLRPRRHDNQLPRSSRFIASNGWSADDQFPFV